jgi:hypothetical protein
MFRLSSGTEMTEMIITLMTWMVRIGQVRLG